MHALCLGSSSHFPSTHTFPFNSDLQEAVYSNHQRLTWTLTWTLVTCMHMICKVILKDLPRLSLTWLCVKWHKRNQKRKWRTSSQWRAKGLNHSQERERRRGTFHGVEQLLKVWRGKGLHFREVSCVTVVLLSFQHCSCCSSNDTKLLGDCGSLPGDRSLSQRVQQPVHEDHDKKEKSTKGEAHHLRYDWILGQEWHPTKLWS